MSELDLGKKVFFLYPPSVIRDELISRLLEQEYEVYMLKDVAIAGRLLLQYPDSLCFVNLDAGLEDAEWEQWIRNLRDTPATAGIGIGILSYNSDEALQKRYLMDIGIRCGFIKLKLGIEESTRILLATLRANEAKGRRKYVRADCSHDQMAMINLREGPIRATGQIVDISVVGFSCIIDPDPDFKKNTLLHDVQLKMRASLVRTKAIVFGSRTVDGRNLYVVLFPPDLDGRSREKIRGYIQISLQNEIEREGSVLAEVMQKEAASRKAEAAAQHGEQTMKQAAGS